MQRPEHLLGDEFAPLFFWLLREYNVRDYISANGLILAKCVVTLKPEITFRYLRIEVASDNLSYTVREISEQEFKGLPLNTSLFLGVI
jgi:hypothetical protein